MEVAVARQAPLSVYLNSNFADGATSTGNGLTFSFTRPITKDPDDLLYVCLASFTTYNTFPNISKYQQNNTLKILNVMYDATTGLYDYTRILTVVIPDGRYDIGSLLAYLNINCNYQEQIVFDGDALYTTNDDDEAFLYLGLGFDGSNNAQTTIPVLAFEAVNNSAKVQMNPAINPISNAYVKTYLDGNTIATDPYVYAGVYLIVDNETTGFMTTIGYTDRFTQDPMFAPGYVGYGYQFQLSAVPTVSTEVVGENLISMQGPSIIYMSIDAIQNSSRSNDNDLDQLNVIGAIPIDNYFGSFVHYQQTFEEYTLVDHLDTVGFVVTFYDQYKKLVDFRGGWWTGTLHFIKKSDAKNNLVDQQTANLSTVYDPPIDSSYAASNKRQRPNDLGGFNLRPGLFR